MAHKNVLKKYLVKRGFRRGLINAENYIISLLITPFNLNTKEGFVRLQI